MDDLNNDKEIIYFQCEKTLKKQFYKVAQDKNLSPGSLFRAFMRKVVKSHYEDGFNIPSVESEQKDSLNINRNDEAESPTHPLFNEHSDNNTNPHKK